MSLFVSRREKRLWLLALVILTAIYSMLGLARTLAGFLRERDLLTNFFWLAIWLVLATIVLHGLRTKAGKFEIAVWIGIIVVYLLVFLRMAVPEERSHMIEYGVLAVFIHEALKERFSMSGRKLKPALIAILITSLFGIIDECIQLFIPVRVFDPIDIGFNTLAGLMAIISSVALSWARSKIDSTMGKK
jgi:hypothetical protein